MNAQFLLLLLMSYDVEIVRSPKPADYEITVIRAEKPESKPPTSPPLPKIEKPPIHTPAGLHSHTCPQCGTRWSHGGNSAGKFPDHHCPKCGTLQFDIDPVSKPATTMPVLQSSGGCPGGNCPTQSIIRTRRRR